MIVRDEEDNLAETLRALAGLVDEVVIYDTGSADATSVVAGRCAHEAGLDLVFVEGYWDDDFSRARNASLDRCRGVWVLVVDADETVLCADPAALRGFLGAQSTGMDGPDAFAAQVVHVPRGAASGGESWSSTRVFARSKCRWTEPIHEQIRTLSGEVPVGTHLPGLVISHRGYRPSPAGLDEGNGEGGGPQAAKALRNLRIAEKAVGADGGRPPTPHALVSYARALAGAGRPDDALAAFERALSDPRIDPEEARAAREGSAWAALGARRLDAAADSIADLWRRSDSPALPAYLSVSVELRRAELSGDGLLLERCAERAGVLGEEELCDDNGTLYGTARCAALEVSALAQLGRFAEAAERSLSALAAGHLLADLGFLVRVVAADRRPLAEIAEAAAPWLYPTLQAGTAGLGGEQGGELRAALADRWSGQDSITPPSSPRTGGDAQSAGGRRAPFLSASMIVRDEEASLATCLRSLAGLVDQVVIYDTGSTDRTAEVARIAAEEAGLDLLFIEGFWDDDFARARNVSIGACRGVWVLVVDADEQIVCDDPAEVRRNLRAASASAKGSALDIDACQVANRNEGAGLLQTSSSHVNLRVLRPDRCRYAKRVHEHLLRIDDGSEPISAFLPGLTVLHAGYGETGSDRTRRAERNLHIARRSVSDAPGDPLALVDLGMALCQAGDIDQGAGVLTSVLGFADLPGPLQRRVLVALVDATLRLGRLAEARNLVADLYRRCEIPVLPRFLEAYVSFGVAAGSDDAGRARSAYRQVVAIGRSLDPHEVDEDGRSFGAEMLSPYVAQAHAALGEPADAAVFALDLLAARGVLDVDLDLLLGCMDSGGVPLDAFADTLPPFGLPEVLERAVHYPPGPRRRLLDALRRRWPDDPALAASYGALETTRTEGS